MVATGKVRITSNQVKTVKTRAVYHNITWIIMAFFGLTALGSQNSFLSTSKNFRNIQIFDDNDFEAAWIKVNGTSAKFCQVQKLGDVMRALFHGPVPPNDNDAIVRRFEEESQNFESEGVLSFTVYFKTMVSLAIEAETAEFDSNDAPLPTCEYFSSKEIQDDMLRNRRYKNDPREKQIRTLTCSQEYGWHDAQEQLKSSTRAARTQSDITKFAAELIKNGVYY